jgi:mycofactocin precursor
MEPNDHVHSETGAGRPATSHDELVTETLVEEVSIDGMCGVY